MTGLDWAVMLATLLLIAGWGWWSSRGVKDLAGYVRSNTLKWPTVGLSIMATQASAITFLSTPGQAYEDGMRFVQFYLGLPLAMIVISAVFVPIYFRLKVYTAYEFLEHRFDVRVRTLGAMLFLVQRGLAAGITIYAPAIILSSILGWSLQATNIGIGLLVVLYTVSGGTAAVSRTQKQQMIVMLSGMALAGILVAMSLPEEVSLPGAVKLAGALDRMNPVSFALDWESRYTFWSGITGGFFLAMAYFGTDQSQVQRYLSGKSVTESRLGLLFNGIFKIPMQFGILFVGVLVFVFYIFNQPPVFFNGPALERVRATPHAAELADLERRFESAHAAQRDAATAHVLALDGGDEEATRVDLRARAQELTGIRTEARELVGRALPNAETKDADYVFISFVLKYLPHGIIGLLIAAILCAAMSSTASELAALGSTTTIDLYRRYRQGPAAAAPPAPDGATPAAVAPGPDGAAPADAMHVAPAPDDAAAAAPDAAGAPAPDAAAAAADRHDLLVSKLFTVMWGLVAVAFASFASLVDNLIQAVNILGSIFYGTVLGLFVVAFFVKRVSAGPVLVAALIAQATVIALFFLSNVGFLWYNVIGCGIVVVLSLAFEELRRARPSAS